jgi:hypothetical protein
MEKKNLIFCLIILLKYRNPKWLGRILYNEAFFVFNIDGGGFSHISIALLPIKHFFSSLRIFERLGLLLSAYVDFLFNESFYGQLK